MKHRNIRIVRMMQIPLLRMLQDGQHLHERSRAVYFDQLSRIMSGADLRSDQVSNIYQPIVGHIA